MSDVIAPALVAAAAALLGVALGALLEPFKLRAAARARVRQDRAERCARLIESAMGCRSRLLSLNLAHRVALAGEPLEGDNAAERLEAYRAVRKDLRTATALLRLCGPDVLVEAALEVREAEGRLRAARFMPDDQDTLDRDEPPAALLALARDLERTVHAFAGCARRYTS